MERFLSLNHIFKFIFGIVGKSEGGRRALQEKRSKEKRQQNSPQGDSGLPLQNSPY